MGLVTARDEVMTDGLDEFVRAHYRRLVGLLVLRLGSRLAAEEVAHESLLKLVRDWDRVRVMEHPWSWLAAVAVNQSRSRWRRLVVADRVERRLAPMTDVAESEEGLTDLLLTIGRLPDRQRTALLLRHYARLSVRDTAEAMGCAEGTVKSLTSRSASRGNAPSGSSPS
jgi:RNA polymerase sigma factor (sigma-70 family)